MDSTDLILEIIAMVFGGLIFIGIIVWLLCEMYCVRDIDGYAELLQE